MKKIKKFERDIKQLIDEGTNIKLVLLEAGQSSGGLQCLSKITMRKH